jgi:hypothetical protein
MRTWLKTLQSEHVAFTGMAWLKRSELQRIVRERGGFPTSDARVTGNTTVLVRGDSSVWAFGDYGTKERHAARLVRTGAAICLVHDSEFRKLVENGRPARAADRIAGDPVRWLEPSTERQFERAALKAGPLDQEHSVLGRLEQSYLRQRLFRGAEHATCALCGKRLPVGLLIAVHVKPRSECSRRERLDAQNIVFGLCLLGCDALYERGLVAVGEAGRVLISTAEPDSVMTAFLKRFNKRTCRAWNKATAGYFKWHVTRRFQGAKTTA